MHSHVKLSGCCWHEGLMWGHSSRNARPSSPSGNETGCIAQACTHIYLFTGIFLPEESPDDGDSSQSRALYATALHHHWFGTSLRKNTEVLSFDERHLFSFHPFGLKIPAPPTFCKHTHWWAWLWPHPHNQLARHVIKRQRVEFQAKSAFKLVSKSK